MEDLYIVTGANGHLGNTIIRRLVSQGKKVRGLVLKNDHRNFLRNLGVEIIRGDILDKYAIDKLFAHSEKYCVKVIHAASLITIKSKYDPSIYTVNIIGTQNILKACKKYGVKKLVYVSSVHAIPEKNNNKLIKEISYFDPNKVVGHYSKSKAIATQHVLSSVGDSFDIVVVHPSGIIGPYDFGLNGHLTKLILQYIKGSLRFYVDGGYNFVDVRDVAKGILLALEKGKNGETYILSGHYASIKDLLQIVSYIIGYKPLKAKVPYELVNSLSPIIELFYNSINRQPLLTPYSLYTLKSNSNFSHLKATKQLGYTSRPLVETLNDTINWIIRTYN